MRINVKAALLSALVLPGLGQLYKGEKVKGITLILLVNLFLLAMVFAALKYVVPFIITAGMQGSYDTKQIVEHLNSGGPVVRLLLASFCGLWIYSWIDAAIGNRHRE
jgi:TM2 domain-containing membrane protein YozV